MKILAVDVGTGTQDILLFDTRQAVENSLKLVLPAPTMMLRQKIQAETRSGAAVLLNGVQMGGGPLAWAAEDHLRAGLPVYATPEAATTFNDDLDAVAAMGVQILSEEEAQRLPSEVSRLALRDFDFDLLQATFAGFGVRLDDLDAVAVAVFDHGAAPREVSDRQYRFDYLDARIRAEHRLSAFAYRAEDIPADLTRLRSVAASAPRLPAPLVVMDTAPAAVLGAQFDAQVQTRPRRMVCNVGNFHCLAFRLGETGIEGVFEHHTGLLDRRTLEALLLALADGSLRHADVFGSMGHGALVYAGEALPMNHPDFNVVVTGPRRAMLRGSRLKPYFAAPYGDMMIAGCFGLLAACADVLPALGEEIRAAMLRQEDAGVAPWDAGR